MQIKIKQQLFAYLLSVTVFFTLGMDFNASNNMFNEDTAYNSPMIINSKEQANNDNMLPQAQPSSESQEHIQSTVKLQENRFVTQMEMKTEEEKAAEYEELTSIYYEVTSHYLNVRANNNARSKILNVVKNGDILEVLEKANNDWLKLKNGGYVHSKYAELISESWEQPKKSAKVAVLSAGHITVKENIIRVATPSKPTTTVKSDSRLTEEQIAQIFEGTLLADQDLEKTILEIEQEYGINAYFTIAVMKLESGHGKSKIARDKNNLFGLNAIDGDAYNKAFSFETKGDSVEKFGQLISDNYIDKGYTSVEKVASKYCKANPKWSTLVMNIMKKDYKKLL